MHDTNSPEKPPVSDRPRLSASAVAAVVQAAYILDAVRR
jgi:hypothetical protein